MAYEINPHAAHAENPYLQGLLLRRGDDQIRTGEQGLRADWLQINPDETLHIDGCTLPGDHEGPCDTEDKPYHPDDARLRVPAAGDPT